MDRLLRLYFSVVFAIFCVAMSYAQNAADQLFMQGQNFASVMKINSQKSAILKFKAAKVKYMTADKKKMCDNQIAICNQTIKKLRKPASHHVVKETNEPAVQPKVKEVKRNDIALAISPNRLDYAYNPKEGATQSVEVDCNYNDWKVDNNVDWITVYTAEKKFSVEVAENTTEEERSGVVKITCGDKTVDLVVNQAKPTQLGKFKDAVGGLFKKKKKK